MRNSLILAAAASALALSACGEGEPLDDVDEINDIAEEDGADDAYPVGGDLTSEQQASYDAMDRQAVSDEYDANQDAMMADGTMSGSSSGTMASDTSSMSDDAAMGGGMADSSSGNMADSGDAMQGSSGNMQSGNMASNNGQSVEPLRPRSQMDFAFLDRNSDGELSVAEYAIWAVRANPRTDAPNDARPPYMTTAQINEAGTTFFYFDEDGDSYLSESEFMNARNSARTPGGSS